MGSFRRRLPAPSPTGVVLWTWVIAACGTAQSEAEGASSTDSAGPDTDTGGDRAGTTDDAGPGSTTGSAPDDSTGSAGATTGGEGPGVETAADLHAERTVFLTSIAFDGALGGLEGADSECQSLADAAGLDGVFFAWLSDSGRSPATRFVRGEGPYVLVDGTPIAIGWGDLVDGELDYGIGVEEGGAFAFDPVEAWTNTGPDGHAVDESMSCRDWASADPLPVGGFGDSTRFRDGWSRKDVTNCNTSLRLYCFQQ